MEQNTSINVTESAQKRIQNLLPEYESDAFRVYVTGGGCSGFQYGFKFDSEEAFDDDIIDFGNFRVLLDSLSYPYLYGSELDYVEDLSGAKFIIKNPNAKTTCGCGESFTVYAQLINLFSNKLSRQKQQTLQILKGLNGL